MLITSTENPNVKAVVLLKSRAGRKKQNAFLLEGAKLIREALKCGYDMTACFVSEKESKRYGEFEQTYLASDSVMKKICETETPQGIAAVFKQKEITAEKNDRIIVLENIQDPGNFGTILRTAEALGIDAVCTVGSHPDRFSGKVMRSAMGAALRVPIVSFNSCIDASAYFKNEGITAYAAVLDRSAVAADRIEKNGKTAIVVGNEGNGLSEEMISVCEKKVYIPMKGVTESFNAAVASSILMWELSK